MNYSNTGIAIVAVLAALIAYGATKFLHLPLPGRIGTRLTKGRQFGVFAGHSIDVVDTRADIARMERELGI